MMKRADLEKIVRIEQSDATERYAYLVPALPDLYRLGLTIRQLEQLLPVGRQWIRHRLRDQNVKFRPTGGRRLTERRVDPDAVIGVLKKHGIDLKDLPGPSEKRRRR